jgi:hypothetical protein
VAVDANRRHGIHCLLENEATKDVEVILLDLDVTLLHLLTVHVTHILIEGVEARYDAAVCLDQKVSKQGTMLRSAWIMLMYADTALPNSPDSVLVTFSVSLFKSVSSSVTIESFFSTSKT